VLRSTAMAMVVLACSMVCPATTNAHSSPLPGLHSTSLAGPQEDFAQEEAALRDAIGREPRNTAYLNRLGSILALENKIEESARIFEKALKINPGDSEARRSLATDYWQLNQPEKARANLEMVLRGKPTDTLAMLLLGLVSEELGDHQRAAKLLGEVPTLVRQRPEAISALARAYYYLGETQKAKSTLQLLIDHPGGPEATFQGGRLAAESKDYQTAEKMFLSIQTTYPDDGVLNYNLALAQFSGKRYSESEKTLLASIEYGYGMPDSYALLRWTYTKKKRNEKMLKTFERTINSKPSKEQHFIDLEKALMENRKYRTTLEVAKETIKRFPSSSQVYRLKGAIELRMYLLTEALKSYTTATELDPNNAIAALGLALTLWNMDRTEDAAKSFQEGIRQFPNDSFFLLKYALFLLNAPGERDVQVDARIRGLLKKSEELDGFNAETHYQLASLALNENKYDEALKELQASASIDPEVSKVHLLLARVYRRTGREADAEKETQLHRKLKEKEEQNVDATAAIGTRHP